MFFSPKSYLGINIGAGGVKLVELKKVNRRPVLFTYGYTSEAEDLHKIEARSEYLRNELLNKDKLANGGSQKDPAALIGDKEIEKYAGLLREVCRAAKTLSKKAVVNLPASALFHTVVTLPKSEKQNELNQMIKAEVKKLLPRPLEEIALDYQMLPGKKEDKIVRVLINAVPIELIAFYTRVFSRAGLELVVLEPASAALVRSLVGRDTALTMIVDLGAERTNFFIVDEGVPVSHQSIEIGGHKIGQIIKDRLGVAEADLIEQIKYDLGQYYAAAPARKIGAEEMLKVFMPVADPIVKEIEYGLDVYLRQAGNEGKRAEKIILTGGASFLPGLSKYIERAFKLKCYIGDPWSRVVYQESLKPELNRIGPRMAMAIGLALRNVI